MEQTWRFRRQVLLEIGGFDAFFGAGTLFAGEDIDAASRASARGWTGKYCPEVVVSHHHGRKVEDLPRLMRFYDIGRAAYHMKLLIRGRQISSFISAVYGLRQRMKGRPSTVYWELVGSYRYLLQIIRRRC